MRGLGNVRREDDAEMESPGMGAVEWKSEETRGGEGRQEEEDEEGEKEIGGGMWKICGGVGVEMQYPVVRERFHDVETLVLGALRIRNRGLNLRWGVRGCMDTW